MVPVQASTMEAEDAPSLLPCAGPVTTLLQGLLPRHLPQGVDLPRAAQSLQTAGSLFTREVLQSAVLQHRAQALLLT